MKNKIMKRKRAVTCAQFIRALKLVGACNPGVECFAGHVKGREGTVLKNALEHFRVLTLVDLAGRDRGEYIDLALGPGDATQLMSWMRWLTIQASRDIVGIPDGSDAGWLADILKGPEFLSQMESWVRLVVKRGY